MRAAYYICDPLISTSNPPTTHSCPGEPAFEAPRKPHFLATRIDYRDLPAIRVASIQPVLRRVSITRPSSLLHPLLSRSYQIIINLSLFILVSNFCSSIISRICVRTTEIDRKSEVRNRSIIQKLLERVKKKKE